MPSYSIVARRKRPAIFPLVLLGVLGGGCSDESLLPGDVPPPPIVWRGEHVQVGTELDLEQWCPGTLPELDAQTGALKQIFGAPEDAFITYYLFEAPLSDLGVCPQRGAACSIPGEDTGIVLTDELPDYHEVVHALGWSTNHIMPHFFEEGAATYWGGLRPGDTDFHGTDVEELLDTHWGGGMSFREYVRAAHFISYLVDSRGRPRLLALREATWWSQSRSTFEPIFADAMGLRLDEAIDDYEEQPYCDYESIRSSFFECGREPDHVLTTSGEVIIDLDISCSNPQVLGPRRLEDGTLRIWRDIAVDVEDGVQNVSFESPVPGVANTVAVEIKLCATDCYEVWTNSRTLRPRGTPAEPDHFSFDLLPGRYVVRVSRSSDDPGRVRFRWR